KTRRLDRRFHAGAFGLCRAKSARPHSDCRYREQRQRGALDSRNGQSITLACRHDAPPLIEVQLHWSDWPAAATKQPLAHDCAPAPAVVGASGTRRARIEPALGGLAPINAVVGARYARAGAPPAVAPVRLTRRCDEAAARARLRLRDLSVLAGVERVGIGLARI